MTRQWLLSSLGLALTLGSVACTGTQRHAVVRPGIDVLLADSLHLVTNRRVGILTNQAGVDAAGLDDISRLRAAGVQLTAIFSPEHGFRGRLDRENIEDDVDSATGLPIYSLYGAVREPTPEMLATIDVLLVDLPDIGARTFTYVSTALRTLGAAGAAGIPVVVLDRPNPIGGVLTQGTVLDTTAAPSFVGMLPVPLRHGMTLGELVAFGKHVLGLSGDLVIVPAAGWRRDTWFDATGLPWVRPSPNMPDLESATHYPGLVLFEATALSVGRGTPIAFQVLGAPWLDAAGLAAALAGAQGVNVRDTTITPRNPTDGKHAGVTFPAIRLEVTDRTSYDPIATAVMALVWLADREPALLGVNARRFDLLAGGSALRLAVEGGDRASAIVGEWAAPLRAFAEVRRRYLLY